MAQEVIHLKEMYKTLNVAVQEESVSKSFERFSAVEVGGERYGSSTSRSIRSSYILASWVSTGGRVDTSASEPRAGCVKFYLRQNVCIAYVMWYQNHPNKDYFGQPLQVCCKDLFEQLGPATSLPVQRIQSKFVPAFQRVNGEDVHVVYPLTRKIACA